MTATGGHPPDQADEFSGYHLPELHELHHLAKQGNIERLRELLHANRSSADTAINAYDRHGYTPLMYAVKSRKASVDVVRLLLDSRADLRQWSGNLYEGSYAVDVMPMCLAGGDPQKIAVLLEHGADLHYQRGEGYDALIDAVCSRDLPRDSQLIDLLKLLVANGVALSGVTSNRESALRRLSRSGRFDAVRLLLEAGADETQLEWTPLIHAVAVGSFADVEEAIARGVWLEERDWWERTAWLVAVHSGDIGKARLLLEHGADAGVCGRCATPPCFYAIENHHTPMLQWLLETGHSIEQTDEFGMTALMAAAECGNVEAVGVLVKAGADVSVEYHGGTALGVVATRELVIRLLNAGADPAHLSSEGRRALVGLDPEADESLVDVPPKEFRSGRSRRFGTRNPEEIRDPFWEGMIRTGISGYEAAQLYAGQVDSNGSPVWCAQRFGQSITLLPDGRVVQIGGEHEDSYDPDFCIYNDVFVHEPDATIRIFGYPESIFPPTDFHTATLIGEHIYIIGSLGYKGARQYGTTPVYRLHTKTFRIEAVHAGGEAPGWIYGHRAIRPTAHQIRISGGKILTANGTEETRNEKSFLFDTERLTWRSD